LIDSYRAVCTAVLYLWIVKWHETLSWPACMNTIICFSFLFSVLTCMAMYMILIVELRSDSKLCRGLWYGFVTCKSVIVVFIIKFCWILKLKKKKHSFSRSLHDFRYVRLFFYFFLKTNRIILRELLFPPHAFSRAPYFFFNFTLVRI